MKYFRLKKATEKLTKDKKQTKKIINDNQKK